MRKSTPESYCRAITVAFFAALSWFFMWRTFSYIQVNLTEVMEEPVRQGITATLFYAGVGCVVVTITLICHAAYSLYRVCLEERAAKSRRVSSHFDPSYQPKGTTL